MIRPFELALWMNVVGRELELDRNRFGVRGDRSRLVTLKRSDDNDLILGRKVLLS